MSDLDDQLKEMGFTFEEPKITGVVILHDPDFFRWDIIEYKINNTKSIVWHWNRETQTLTVKSYKFPWSWLYQIRKFLKKLK